MGYQDIISCKYFQWVKFDLRSVLQGQTESADLSLLLVLGVWNVKTKQRVQIFSCGQIWPLCTAAILGGAYYQNGTLSLLKYENYLRYEI